jgi:hypothetical protein
MYSVSGTSGTIPATIDLCIGALWNPHSTKDIKVRRVVYTQDSTDTQQLVDFNFITARGTPLTTTTPVIANHHQYAAAPQSGALLDFGGYSVEPTSSGAGILAAFRCVVQFHFLIFEGEIVVKAGTGLGIFSRVASSISYRLGFFWEEDW